MKCCMDPRIMEAIDGLNAESLGLYPVDSATLLIQRKMSPIEKLQAIPPGRYIKLSDCNTFDIIYFILREDEKFYTVAMRKTINAFARNESHKEKLIEDLRESGELRGWDLCDKIGSWSAGLDAYIWVKREKLRADEVLLVVDPHIILSHEIYEFKSDIHLKKRA